MYVWLTMVHGKDVCEGIYSSLEMAEKVAKERHRDDKPVYVQSIPVDFIPPEDGSPLAPGREGGSWYPALEPRPAWVFD